MCHYFPQDALGTHGFNGPTQCDVFDYFRKECFKMRFPSGKDAWCHWSQFALEVDRWKLVSPVMYESRLRSFPMDGTCQE